jgi:hypothetical protein
MTWSDSRDYQNHLINAPVLGFVGLHVNRDDDQLKPAKLRSSSLLSLGKLNIGSDYSSCGGMMT